MKNQRLRNGYGMVSNAVIRDPDLSFREKAIYAYFATYANMETNELTVGLNRIAAECGIDQSTVKRSIKVLSEKGIIKRISRGLKDTAITILLK